MKLKEMNAEQLEKLLNDKQELQNMVYNRIYTFELEEIVYELQNMPINDFSIGGRGDFIKVEENNYKEFIAACLHYHKEFFAFTEETGEKLERMLKVADKYLDFLNGYKDISYNRLEQLYTWFEDGIADAKEELLTWFQNRLDIDYSYMLDEFIYLAEDGFFDNMDFDPEQNVLTETVTNKIA